jgi:uncharacterized membrane protein
MSRNIKRGRQSWFRQKLTRMLSLHIIKYTFTYIKRNIKNSEQTKLYPALSEIIHNLNWQTFFCAITSCQKRVCPIDIYVLLIDLQVLHTAILINAGKFCDSLTTFVFFLLFLSLKGRYPNWISGISFVYINTKFALKWVPVTTAWRVLRMRMEERPPVMEGSCECIE